MIADKKNKDKIIFLTNKKKARCGYVGNSGVQDNILVFSHTNLKHSCNL